MLGFEVMNKKHFFSKKNSNNNLTAYTLMSPFLVVFSLFLIAPFFWSIGLSFAKGKLLGPKTFVGFQNYIDLFQNDKFLGSILTTFKYMGIIIPAIFLVSISVALLLYSVRNKFFKNLFRTIIIIPYLSSAVIAAIIWRIMLYPGYGAVDRIISFLHIPNISWFGDPRVVLFTVALVELWRGSGFFILVVLAGIESIDPEILDASHIDGANYFQSLRYIILPGLKPVLTFMLIMLCIWQLQVFDSIYMLTKGGPAGTSTTAVWYIYMNTFSYGKVGVGATMSVFLIIIIAIITVINLSLTRFREQTM
jgi:multiple sugar transport system permease protein